jgi:DNA protecting protein DprA
MAKPREPGLFDEQDDAPRHPAEVPFAVALLALGGIHGLGQKGLQVLVGQFADDLGAVFRLPQEAIEERLSACKVHGAKKIALAVVHSADEIIERGYARLKDLEAKSVKLIPPSGLPERFRALGTERPKWLFVQGDDNLLAHHPTVAVIGTRKPTDGGCRAAAAISNVLSSYPVLLVSGLADGIDAEAHASSLSRDIKNMAFLGHGINLVFPEETASLRAQIVRQGGAIVSEYMPDQNYQKRQFVERNRLQAALADLVIPVEGASASGTAHTARFARKYGRVIVGVKWKGANGLVDDLTKEGDKIIEILTVEGQRELDGLVQRIVSEASGTAYPFQTLERQIAREMRGRSFRPEDVTKLIETIQKLGQESPKNG